MKRCWILILALSLLLWLPAGCSGGTGEADPTGHTPAAVTEAAQTESPWQYAAGNYALDARGYPLEPYEYALPLTTAGEVFTFWTSSFTPQYIPEGGMESMPVPVGMEEQTGVHIEYIVNPYDTRAANFATMLAADDLPDIMAQGIDQYPGSYYEAVDDGYFVNLYDYRAYCPNYIYQATRDPADLATYEGVFYDEDFIIAFYCLWEDPYYSANKVIRGDYLEKVGMQAEDLVTWDDWFNALSAIQSQIDAVTFPWPLTAGIDIKGSYSTSPSFDTLGFVNSAGLPDVYIYDGQVCFGNMTARDRDYMAMLNRFYDAGLIDPDWGGYVSSVSFADKIGTGEIAIMDMAATEIPGYNASSLDPDCDWVALARPLQYAGQVLHVGGDLSRVTAGNSSISAKCSNIELAVSWCDYRYSPSGSFFNCYGPEGVIWEYNEDGEIRATDWALNHEMGFAWVCSLYALNNIFEHGLEDTDRKTIFEGGEAILETRAFWSDYDYDGAYQFPVGCRLTAEQEELVNDYAADIQTYIAETYVQFLDGGKPFSEWDAYVDTLWSLGMQEIIDIYQQAYDAYLQNRAA